MRGWTGFYLLLFALSCSGGSGSGSDGGVGNGGGSGGPGSLGGTGGNSSRGGSSGGAIAGTRGSGNGGGNGGGGTAGARGTFDPATCPGIAGRTFSSVNSMECGLGGRGVLSCNWNLAFSTNGWWSWDHSDMQGSGMYSCSGSPVMTVALNGAIAQYDAQSDSLTFGGAVYLPQ